MKLLSALICISFIISALADTEIKDVKSLHLEGVVSAYFTVTTESDEAAVIHSKNGVLTLIPGEGDKIFGNGQSTEGPWLIQLMHPTATETHFKPEIEGASVMGAFYANDDIEVLYQDVDGVVHKVESGNAKVEVTKSGDALKLDYQGDLKFEVLSEESLNVDETHDTRKLHHKKMGYGYSQPSYYPVYQQAYYRPAPVYYRPAPVYSQCCPTSYVRLSPCHSSC